MPLPTSRRSGRGSLSGRPLLSGLALRWLAAVLLVPAVYALDPERLPSQYHIEQWRNDVSGADASVRALTQSADGALWVATAAQAARFDGRTFVAAAPRSDPWVIEAVAARRGGGVWIATVGGVFHAAAPGGTTRAAALTTSARALLELPGGELVVATDSTLVRIPDPAAPQQNRREHPVRVVSLQQSPRGDLWIGSSDQGLLHWDRDAAAPRVVAPLTAQAIAADGNRGAWVGTANELYHVTPDGADPVAAVHGVDITALCLDRSGSLWIGSRHSGLIRLRDGVRQSIHKDDGLISDWITALYEDREGNLWVGTSLGLNQLVDVKFPLVTNREGLVEGSAHTVYPARAGGVWVGTSGGFARVDGPKIVNYDVSVLPGNIYIKLVFEAKNGDVYVSRGDKRISVLSGGTITDLVQPEDWPEAITEDADGILLGAGPRLFRVKGRELIPYEAGPPNFDYIHHLAVTPDGSLLVASAAGLYRFPRGGAGARPGADAPAGAAPAYQHWSTANGLSVTRTYAAFEDTDGHIWAATPGGLALIRPSGVTMLAEEQGLADRRLYMLADDDRGNLWTMASRGLIRLRKRDALAVADRRQRTLHADLYNSPPAIETVERTDQGFTGARSSDGRVWFPSPRGLLLIEPDKLAHPGEPPLVTIEHAGVPGASWDARVPAGEPVEFRFAALSFADPERTRVQYRLTGLDTTWIDAADRRAIEYRQLPAGDYAFEVRAVSSSGAANDARVAFQVLRPFHQTWWFYVTSGAVLAAAFGGAYAWKMRRVSTIQLRLREQNEKLEEAVAERTRQLSREQALRVEASRRAGMAEVAANVLHNVGNVLNSANVSASLITSELQRCRIPLVPKLAELLEAQQADLPRFLQEDPRGQKVPAYLLALGSDLMESRQKMEHELRTLQHSIEHIKEIVAMQQGLTHACGVLELIRLRDVVEDALRIQAPEFDQHRVKVRRDFTDTRPISLERHKALQIAINLLQNAVHACRDANRPDREVIVRIEQVEVVRLIVTDNGVGIPAENMTRIFSHGFTTKRHGHGFGLHGSALAAQEMGGLLTAHSDGPGTGATFTLTLPLVP